jgi:hypothetical protein
MKSFFIHIGFLLLLHFQVVGQKSTNPQKLSTLENTGSKIKTVQKFLSWYKLNYKRTTGYKMVYTEKSGYYKVNIKECTGFFKDLQTSGFISPQYVKVWCEYCTSQNEKFAISPQNEGPPEGFDMDLVLLNQEPEETFKHYTHFKYSIADINHTTSIVYADTGWPDMIYVFELSRIKNKWYIDYISIKEPG